ncbi:DALR anticodon-binding domain-containing protein [Actinomadura rudentiformis]|uniref:Anticodon-binding protein n=1 Tax=Actinomadura rudentiformis TaxID=359158 RepID=A0A6H9YIM6_9ACTN|nr:DALR anticodon-binding domain-containing protein [Actinomadura rudentiformis]KAB2345925.1 anticodon-binding protein [Actinomadura rudentiformis]
MTPADVSSAIARAVGVREVPLTCVGAGLYGSPVALRMGLDPEGVAERVREEPGILGVETSGGFLTVSVGVAETVQSVLDEGDAYGRAEVPRGGWADRPRIFENPGFRVRYAYARAVAVGRRARDLGLRGGTAEGLRGEELAVVGALGDFPGRAAQAERERDASALMKCLERLADAFHGVYERCPALPQGDEKPGAVHEARVTLAKAARIALGNGLKMIGETPRERI